MIQVAKALGTSVATMVRSGAKGELAECSGVCLIGPANARDYFMELANPVGPREERDRRPGRSAETVEQCDVS